MDKYQIWGGLEVGLTVEMAGSSMQWVLEGHPCAISCFSHLSFTLQSGHPQEAAGSLTDAQRISGKVLPLPTSQT